MALIIVDGYNITGVLRGDIEAARDELINAVSDYNKSRGHDITVVFDGWKDGHGRERRYATGGIKVVFSALGEKADSAIKRIVTKDSQWIVVSSDRDIQAHAWAVGSVPVGSEEFLRAVERGSAGSAPAAEEDDFPGHSRQSRGNPRKKSRKQKAREWALRKL